MSWIVHMDQSYHHHHHHHYYHQNGHQDDNNGLSIQTNNFMDKCRQRISSSTPKLLNLSLLADKFVDKIVEKLSILDGTKRNGTKKINESSNNDYDDFWPFIKHIILIILIIGFYYLMFTVGHHRWSTSSSSSSAQQNGSMFIGPAYHTGNISHNYFYWNYSATISDNISSAFNDHYRLKSIRLSPLAITKMNDEQFIRYLFDNIQLWID
ncbi:uncharacterized protein LOC124490650 [Dermatophagoides farinae]|uniref:Uncharacterized protein n=1 Tax=Dermatophagoides farinae TaxID=6954 RepID=A0A922I8X1_DERFA|nr:uncharacterized protein LOC124490650 [Dermatophagoides farinae]KAH9522840.1 hypothetical protein DERF_006398 [Dermatophagoides farinae]